MEHKPYIVLTAKEKEYFEDRVDTMIHLGYILSGGISITRDVIGTGITYYQAMVLRPRLDDEHLHTPQSSEEDQSPAQPSDAAKS